MPEITLRFDELESGDLPLVCMQCGSRRDVDLIPRTFVWRPIFAPPVLAMIMTKRVAADIPLCPAHGGYRLFSYQRAAWWGLRTVAVSSDRITIGGAHEDFIDALYRRRENREHGDGDEAPAPRRRVQAGRGTGGGTAALKMIGILAAVMIALTVLMTCGMFGLMGLGTLFLPKAGPPSSTPVASVAPMANVEPSPEGVVVGLVGMAPHAGGLAAMPWAPLALSARKEIFHVLDDAELTKALTDLRSPFPHVIEAAAKALAEARPMEARRKETAAALKRAMDNPFPTVKEAAAVALGIWGTSDDAPALIQMLGDVRSDSRAAAMTALAGLKDEQGAAAVAQRLPNLSDRRKARTALEAMGPVAEKAAAPLLTHADPLTRLEACGILKAVGTRESVPALEMAARDPNLTVAHAAADAVETIKGRP